MAPGLEQDMSVVEFKSLLAFPSFIDSPDEESMYAPDFKATLPGPMEMPDQESVSMVSFKDFLPVIIPSHPGTEDEVDEISVLTRATSEATNVDQQSMSKVDFKSLLPVPFHDYPSIEDEETTASDLIRSSSEVANGEESYTDVAQLIIFVFSIVSVVMMVAAVVMLRRRRGNSMRFQFWGTADNKSALESMDEDEDLWQVTDGKPDAISPTFVNREMHM